MKRPPYGGCRITREIVYQDKNKTSETYIFRYGNLVYYEKLSQPPPLRGRKIDKRFLPDSIMTLDIETRKLNDKLIPICLSIYGGSTAKTASLPSLSPRFFFFFSFCFYKQKRNRTKKLLDPSRCLTFFKDHIN